MLVSVHLARVKVGFTFYMGGFIGWNFILCLMIVKERKVMIITMTSKRNLQFSVRSEGGKETNIWSPNKLMLSS